jgi:NTE family protein
VFSGGGVKGIAFGGAIQAAEEAGYTEWQRLGGTSAGAIAALALAVGYDARGLRSALEHTDYRRIADYGGPFGRVVNYFRRHGLTRGRALREWIESLIADSPRPARTFGELERPLQVVGADLAHSRLVVFPDDVTFYEDEHGRQLVPDEFPIAEAVRVSAGYPFFFPPVRLRDRATKRDGVLVDGGVASAFPVFLFDRPQPTQPTWGFQLHAGRGAEQPSHREIGGLDWPIDMAAGVLDTAMNAFDRHNLQAFGDRTISIPTGDIPTLRFALSRADQEFLYRSGYEAGQAFFAAHPSGRNTLGAVPAPQA